MNTMIHSKQRRALVRGILTVLCTGLFFSVFPQVNAVRPVHSTGVVLRAIRSDSLISADSTVPIMVIAENKGANVIEAIVSLVDSASGDTIENWYPLFPPESADSIVLFWDTKGAKSGNHTLSGILAVPTDSSSTVKRLSRTVTVVR
jgi:hypothetical protein